MNEHESHVLKIVGIPPEWVTAALIDTSAYIPREHEHNSPTMYLVTIVLADGTSMFVLVYPGGERIARVSPHTSWALEERPAGKPPVEEHRAVVDDAWRGWLDALIDLGRRSSMLMRALDEDGPQ